MTTLTKDEVLKLAREAGFIIGRSVTTGEPNSPERFATLCRAPLVAENAVEIELRETCTWTEQDDKDMPGTYESSCGEMWSFIDGGVKENRVTYCHHCGGKVVPALPQEQT